MKLTLGKARVSKDTEASTGPKLLVTVKGNKLIPSPSVREKLGLVSEYDKDGNTVEGKEGNMFNISMADLEDGQGNRIFIHTVDADGYRIGKNLAVSAPQPVRDLLAFFDKSKETYEVAGDGNPRSFNCSVDLNHPVTVLLTEDGEVTENEDEAATTFNLYELKYLADVVKGEGEEEGEEGDETPKKKRTKKAE